MKRKTVYEIIFSVLTVCLLLFIFGNSAADGDTSGKLSLYVLNFLNSLLDTVDIPLSLTHHAVRKLAHFFEYSVLGAVLTITVRVWRRNSWHFHAVWLPLCCGIGVAVLDELLQTLVPGRSGNASDMVLDSCGVLWAALATAVFFVLRRKTSDRREQRYIERRLRRSEQT